MYEVIEAFGINNRWFEVGELVSEAELNGEVKRFLASGSIRPKAPAKSTGK